MIIDSHAHIIGSAGVMVMDDSVEACLSHMDKMGCDYLIQSSGDALGNPANFEGYAEKAIALYEKSGGRMLTSFVFDPKQSEKCIEIIEKNVSHPAFAGIKIHPSDHRVDAEDERYRLVWEIAKKLELPIMSHTWALTSNPKQVFSLPEKFEKFIAAYPEVIFIFGHSGGRVSGIRKAAELGRKYKNAYFDLAGDILDYQLIEYLAENVGADRILLGSDVGWFDVAVAMGMVLGADLTTAEKALILGGNAARIYKIPERKK